MTRSRLSDIALPLIGTAIVVAAWELASRFGAIDPRIFPGPITAISDAAGRLAADTVGDHMAWSLFRVF